jgi:hypothetical protein
MDTNYYQAAPVVRDNNQKRFEAEWFKKEGFADIVQENGTRQQQVSRSMSLTD